MTDFTASAAEAGRRLDVVLAEHLVWTRSKVQRQIKAGLISVNGQAERAGYTVAVGDILAVAAEPEAPAEPLPEIPILYQDEDLLIVDKPAGVLVHTASGRPEGTVAEVIRPLVQDSDPERPGIVHRLDRDTSGLLVIARHPAAKAYLQELFRRRELTKTYLALVVGHPDPPAAVIDLPLGQGSARSVRRSVDPTGRTAQTRYRTIHSYPGYSLLEVQPLTGRTHQIRAHLRALGHPVASDRLYGSGDAPAGLGRQFLHAARLQFRGPHGQTIDVESPLPSDLAAVLAHLDRGVY